MSSDRLLKDMWDRKLLNEAMSVDPFEPRGPIEGYTRDPDPEGIANLRKLNANRPKFLEEYEALCRKYGIVVSYDYHYDEEPEETTWHASDEQIAAHLEKLREDI